MINLIVRDMERERNLRRAKKNNALTFIHRKLPPGYMDKAGLELLWDQWRWAERLRPASVDESEKGWI